MNKATLEALAKFTLASVARRIEELLCPICANRGRCAGDCQLVRRIDGQWAPSGYEYDADASRLVVTTQAEGY